MFCFYLSELSQWSSHRSETADCDSARPRRELLGLFCQPAAALCPCSICLSRSLPCTTGPKSNELGCVQIEDSKENVQPLASGRDARKLAQQLKAQKEKPTQDTTSLFQEACKDWEEQLDQYNGDDRLQVWDDYIRWAQQNATSDKLMAQV